MIPKSMILIFHQFKNFSIWWIPQIFMVPRWKGENCKNHLEVFRPGLELDDTIPSDVTHWTSLHLRAQAGHVIHPSQRFGGEFGNEIGKRDIVSFSALMWDKIGIRLLVGLILVYTDQWSVMAHKSPTDLQKFSSGAIFNSKKWVPYREKSIKGMPDYQNLNQDLLLLLISLIFKNNDDPNPEISSSDLGLNWLWNNVETNFDPDLAKSDI